MRRIEDPKLVTGQGTYVDDLKVEGCLHAAFTRSAVASGRIQEIDAGLARTMPSVVGVYTVADLGLEPRPMSWLAAAEFARPALARDWVRYVGEPVAVAVAETREAAADAALAVRVEIEALPALVDPEDAANPAARVLFEARGHNLVSDFAYGAEAPPLAGEIVVELEMAHQRLAPVPMETNACLAVPDGSGGLIFHACTQVPHRLRGDLAIALGLEESQVRVISPDVGGGFGAKVDSYPEYFVIGRLSLRLGRPIRWTEGRSESFTNMVHGRAQRHRLRLAANSSGHLTGLELDLLADSGAYPGQTAYLAGLTAQMMSGCYLIPAIRVRGRAVATNTVPVSSYRGAGRPEATAVLERGMDLLARRLGLDPVELRRRNLIPSDRFPYQTPLGTVYDSGDYHRALDLLLEKAGYQGLRAEQKARREAGNHLLLGIGVSCYVEMTAPGSTSEYAAVELDLDGKFTIRAGTHAQGQGHQTSYAALVSSMFGVRPESIRVLEGDTGNVPRGDGTYGSRSLQLGGSAVREAGLKLLEQARELASELLEAEPADLVPNAEGLFILGVPGRGLGWAELARSALARGSALAAEHDQELGDLAFAFGAHLAVAEVDIETGAVRLIGFTAVDDCGTILNPLLVEGQVHGGIAQGLGQALYEEFVYDTDGNPLSSSLLDYLVPGAGEVPPVATLHTVTPAPGNPLGVKGVGESGTIGSTPAVLNAVIDAVAHLGVEHIEMPAGPERVWRAIRAARRTG